MKKMIYTLFVIALVASSSAFAAKVTTVALSYQDNQTVARIDVEGPIRFAHQTEVPKEGKGNRLILDVLAATHALSAKTFDQLPDCQVTAIRTSQYSVQPEKVVRVVFDVTKAPLYRVEQKGNSIYIYFTDNTIKPFASWSTSNVSPTPTAPKPVPATASATPKPATTTVASKPEEQRKTSENDRLASLSSAPAPTTPAKPTAPAAEPKPIAKTDPTAPAAEPKPIAKTDPTVAKPSTTTPSTKPVVAPSSVQTSKPAAPVTVVQKPTETVKPEPKPMVPATPKAEPKPMVPATIASNPPAKPAESKPSTANSPSATPTVSPKPATVASAPAQKKETAPAATAPTPKPAVASTPTVAPTKPVDNKPAVTAPTSAPAQPTTNSVAKSEATNKPTTTVAKTEPAKPTTTTPEKPAVAAWTPTPLKSTTAPATVATTPTTTPQTTPTAPKTEVKPSTSANTPTVAVNKPATTPTTSVPVKPSPATPADKPAVSASSPTVAKVDNALAKPSDAKSNIPAPDFTSDTVAEEDLMVAVDPNAPVDEEEELDESGIPVRPNDTSSTARFRRNPAQAAKFKGTMIAEFPKRLVIKYEQKGHRDPFATLIDDSRTTSGPTEKSVPNVDGLRLVGVIESKGPGGNRALFEDKDGYSYILESGDKVQKGYVLRIEDNTVYFQIFEYGWTRTVSLKMEEI